MNIRRIQPSNLSRIRTPTPIWSVDWCRFRSKGIVFWGGGVIWTWVLYFCSKGERGSSRFSTVSMETPHHYVIYLFPQVIVVQVGVCMTDSFILTSKIKITPLYIPVQRLCVGGGLRTEAITVVSHASISFLAGLLQEGKFLKYYLKKIRQKENRQTNQLREGGRGQVTCVRQTPVCLEVLLNKTRQTTTTGTQRRRQSSSCSELTARQFINPFFTHAHTLCSFSIPTDR